MQWWKEAVKSEQNSDSSFRWYASGLVNMSMVARLTPLKMMWERGESKSVE